MFPDLVQSSVRGMARSIATRVRWASSLSLSAWVERNVEIAPIHVEQHPTGLNLEHAGLRGRVDAAVMTGIGQNSLGMVVVHVSADACTHLRSEGGRPTWFFQWGGRGGALNGCGRPLSANAARPRLPDSIR